MQVRDKNPVSGGREGEDIKAKAIIMPLDTNSAAAPTSIFLYSFPCALRRGFVDVVAQGMQTGDPEMVECFVRAPSLTQTLLLEGGGPQATTPVSVW